MGDKIREATGASLSKVLDTVSLDSSAAICADAFGPGGGVHCSLLAVGCPRGDVESVFFLGYDMSGEAYRFEGQDYGTRPEALAFAGPRRGSGPRVGGDLIPSAWGREGSWGWSGVWGRCGRDWSVGRSWSTVSMIHCGRIMAEAPLVLIEGLHACGVPDRDSVLRFLLLSLL